MTLADSKVRLQFLAFERSLRAVGCDLPLLVFPYGKDRFDLPRNAEWWDEKEFTSWLEQHKAHALMLKYFCLTQANFAFFDCDICFIEDFRKPLAQQNGFVVADTEAGKPGWSSTPELANATRTTNKSVVTSIVQWRPLCIRCSLVFAGRPPVNVREV